MDYIVITLLINVCIILILRNRHFLVIITFTVAASAVLNEYVFYKQHTTKWSVIPCRQDAPGCTRVLIVSQPYILLYEQDPKWLQYISYWDSSRYLRTTYTYAVKSFKPDVVLFLGTMLNDEVNPLDFQEHVDQFQSIFKIDTPGMKYFYSFENEHFGMIALNSIDRRVNHVNFAQFEVDTFPLDQPNKTYLFVGQQFKEKKCCTIYDLYTEKLKRAVLLSHHNNSSRVHFCIVNPDKSIVHHIETLLNYDVHQFNLSEIPVLSTPSCTYKYKQIRLGYGSAVFYKDKEIFDYAVLWSPDRYKMLLSYMMTVILLIIFFIFINYCCGWKYPRCLKIRCADPNN